MTTTASARMSRKVTLSLDPLDVLFFRDGRPFGEATRARSGLPSPQILCGAVRNVLLRQHDCKFHVLDKAVRRGVGIEEAFAASCGAGWIARVRTRGPWLARRPTPESESLEVFLPAPATLHREKLSSRNGESDHERGTNGKQRSDALFRFDPLGPGECLPGWRPPVERMRPLWLKSHARTERVTGYVTLDGLRRFLAGGPGACPAPSDLVSPSQLFELDFRTGIEVNANRLTAAEHRLYAASFLALEPKVEFVAEVILPSDAPKDLFAAGMTLAFGGERKQVRVSKTAPIEWPNPPNSGNRTLFMLTTPGLFENGWRPACLSGGALVAAAVPGYEAVSGWNLARGGPKRTRFAVPAGSVFFVEGDIPAVEDGSLADEPEDRLHGWGCFVTGTWNDP